MPSLQQALNEARKMRRTAVIKHTTYKGYEAVELENEVFETNVAFVIPENHTVPVPMSYEASIALGDLLYAAIGWVPEEERVKVPKFLKPKADEPEPEDEAKPVKKKIKLRKKPLTSKR